LTTLDAGASSGEFVYLMKSLGHAAAGIEPHVGYATHAMTRLGLDVTNCTFSEFSYEGNPFQLITLFHVLEHLERPVEDLFRLSRLLDPSGLFVIEVPNILYRGMKFSHKWHAGHLNGFTTNSLKATAAMAGLEAISCGEIGDGGNLFGVFRPSTPLTSEQAISLLSGGSENALRDIRANTDIDYYTRTTTWTKIPRKLLTQLEERRTVSKHLDAKSILDSTFKGLL
jgi:hypothetical protein